MMQGEINRADTPTIRLGATPSGLKNLKLTNNQSQLIYLK